MASESSEQRESTIFIKNLPEDLTVAQLEKALDEYGPVRRAIVVKDKSGVSRGFGYVIFAMPEDAEEAAKKLNNKEFFGKVVSVEIAKPKKRANRTPEPAAPKKLSESKKEEKEMRLHTILIFGLNRQMSLASVQRKFRRFISSSNKANTISWPHEPPFTSDSPSSGDQSSSSHPVAHLTIAPENLPTLKETIRSLNTMPGIFARRLSTIPSNRPNFEKNRMILRNLPFQISDTTLYSYCSRVAPVHSMNIPRKEDGRTLGYGFVQLFCNADLLLLIEKMNGQSIGNRVIVCDQVVSKNQYQKMREPSGEEEEDDELPSGEEEESQDMEEEQPSGEHQAKKDANNSSEEEEEEEDGKSQPSGEHSNSAKNREHLKEKSAVNFQDADEGRTLFVQNIPLDITQHQLASFFKQFGDVIYAKICRDHVTKLPRGTGFVKFESPEVVQTLIQTHGFEATQPKPRSAKNDDSPRGSPLMLEDRPLQISQAITRSSLKETFESRALAKKDNRNLYLLNEGWIKEESRGSMNDRDLEKRKTAQKEKEEKLKNPLFFVNPKRLLIKNLGRFITSNYLKQICLFAVRQAISLDLVHVDEVKLHFRPKDGKIPSKIKIVQAVVPKDESRGSGKSGRGFGFVEFDEHVHALACLRYLNNNPAFSWAAVNVGSVVELYEFCGETIEDDPHRLAKLDIEHLMGMKLKVRKNEPSNSRLIVEFAISNHNVLRQKEALKQKKKEGKKKNMKEEGEENKEKKEFDISRDKSHTRIHFAKSRSRKIRGDYDRKRK